MTTNRYRSLLGIAGLYILLSADVYGQEQAHAQRFDTDGLAQVIADNRAFYIDSTGRRVFDAYENRDRPWPIPAGGGADTCAFVVLKDGRKGLRSIRGKWILEPVFQQIEYLSDAHWKVTKAGQQTITTPTGDVLPYFDEVGYLDGRYFDVKVDDKWGLYDSESQALTTPAIYDGFDYCGGCGRKSDYVYAQQNGKWGIVSFDNRTLVPFAYEHSHWNGMRSGVWVSSFTKNQKPLVVHIPTGNVFMAAGDERLEILNGGELVVAENGKYGLIDTLCQPILPPVYDRITAPNDNNFRGYSGSYAIVETQGKKGIYESGHGLVIQPEWDDARVYDNYFVLARGGRYGLFDHEGNQLLAPGLTSITHINDYFYSSGSNGMTIFKTKQQALYGLFFAETGVEITPRFHEVELRPRTYGEDATFIAGEHQGEEAIFDLAGNELLPLGYDSWAILDSTVHRYLKITKNGLWGVYDTQVKAEVLPTKFQDIRLLAGSDEQVLTVALEGDDTRYGAYTLGGAEVVPPTFGTYNEIGGVASLFSDDRQAGNAILVEGRNGHKTSLPTRHATALAHTSLLMISTDAERGRLYHPFEKRTVSDLEFIYSYHSTPDSRLASLGEFSPHGLAWVHTDGRYGLMDITGQWVKKPLYTAVLPFGERTITVGTKAFPASDWRAQAGYVAYQFIGLDGEPVTDKVYTGPNAYLMDMDYFLGDYLVVRSFDAETGALTVGLADTTGKVVLPTAYDALEAFGGDRYLLLQKDWKIGIADGRGHILLPVEFDNLLLDRYDKETGITFPLLGYRAGEWRYYTAEGSVLTIEGVGDRALSVNTSWW